MKHLYRELKKIAKQMYGSENIFDYKSTAANRLYVFYCFIGEIYFTKKISHWVKYFWFFLVSSELLFLYYFGLGYLLYDEHTDLMMMFNVANVMGANTVATLGFPLVSYFYSDDINAMIELVDDILTTSGRPLGVLDERKVFGWFLGSIMAGITVYSVIGVFDVVLFFEQDKLKNYLYYTYPVPLIERYNSYGYFFFINGVSILVSGLSMFELVSSLAIVLEWNAVCRDELIRIQDDFCTKMVHLEWYSYIENGEETWKEWDKDFERVIRRGIERFRKISHLIDYLRGYVEWIGSILVPVVCFYGGVAILYFRSSEAIPFIVKVKFLSCYWGACIIAFLFYWVGQNLDNLVSAVSLAVYSTPWYWSVRIRKNVYIFLCQTQSVKNLAIIKVYGLLLHNFSRYVQGVFCCMNFLHKITSK